MIKEIIYNLKKSEHYKGQIVKIHEIDGKEYDRFDFPEGVHEELIKKLNEKGIYFLYKHQIEVLENLKKGLNVIITSSTASGKTLSFNIPVVSHLLNSQRDTALYLYPTKALAQDQLEKLKELTSIPVGTYDGDTPQDERNYLRKNGRIIIANPDILHIGFLPNHGIWARFLSNLKFIVIDEAHYYSGVLGSHFAMILRRLRRILSSYGSFPQFILSSATLDNPLEFSFKLVGEQFALVQGPSNPPKKKYFVIFNPALINEEANIRKSTISEAVWVIEELIKNNQKVIVFEKSRKGVELLTKTLRERIGSTYEISPYRAGYTKELRKKIEKSIKAGEIECVVSTNALELGLDIGELDATVIVGYPGSISSLHQQSGRSGRTKESVSIFITSSNPLDQYFTKDPDYLFAGKFGSLNIDLENPYILKAHLLCAAYELPLNKDIDVEYFGQISIGIINELGSLGLLLQRGDRYFINSNKSPAPQINIRSSGEENIKLVDVETNEVLERISKNRALEEAFPQAVYLHLGETYVVNKMDLENKTIFLKRSNVDYYTDSLALETIWIDRVLKEKKFNRTSVYFGEVIVEEVIRGFVKKQLFTDRKIGTEPLELPKIEFKTKAFWFTINEDIVSKINKVDDLLGSIHAAEHSLVGILPLIVQCDRNDVGGVSHPLHPDTNMTTIFLYDGVEGGIGITEKAYDRIEDVIASALKSIATCPCKDGCPSCIFSPKCGNENKPLSKKGAQLLLEELLK